MKQLLFFLIALILLLARPEQLLAQGSAIIHYVAPNGIDAGGCTLVERPCQTISYALTQAFDYSEIRVAAGLYRQPLFVSKSISLTGGFTLTNWFTPTWTTNLTILDGENKYRPLTIRADQVRVDGFVVQNGNATGFEQIGGGLYLGGVNEVNEATLRNLRIENNVASTLDGGEGGGLAAVMGGTLQNYAKLTLENVSLISNTATTGHLGAIGGGISLQAVGSSQLDVEMSQMRIEGNQAGNDFSSSGGGLALNLNHGTATLKQSYILSNHAAFSQTILGGASRGGGIYLLNSNLALENVLLAGNSGERGDAISIQNTGQVSVTAAVNYATLANNYRVVSDALSAIYAEGDGVFLQLNNTLISGNPTAFRTPFTSQPISLTLHNTLIDSNMDSISIGKFESSVTPLRGSANYVNEATGDYHLRATSDAIDKGNNLPPAIDLDGLARPNGSASELGAYEFVPRQPTTQTINFAAIANKQLGAPAFAISATASSGLTVTLISDTPTICRISSKVVTLLAAGTCTIRASQGGDETFSPAVPVTQSFSVINPSGSNQQSVYLPLIVQEGN